MTEQSPQAERTTSWHTAVRESGFKIPMEREELRDVIDLALWAGQMLLQNGAETARVEETVHRMGTGLGANWMDVLVSPNAIIASTISGVEFRTKVRRVVRIGVNMDIITEIGDLSRRVIRDEADRFTVRAELERIDRKKRQYNRWLVVLLVGLACAAFSRLFYGDWGVFFFTWVAASTGMFVRQELTHRNFNPLLITVSTAFVAGLIASIPVALNLGANPEIALAASVLLLVPGVPLVTSAQDLIQGHIVTGLVRGILGLLITLGIALGLTLAMRIAGVDGFGSDPTAPVQSLLLVLLQDAIWSAFAAAGFAMLFNVPRRALLYCALTGAVGHTMRTLVIVQFGMTLEAATLLASVIVGFCGLILARRLKMPTTIFSIPAAIPMVPGRLAYTTMIGILNLSGARPEASLVLLTETVIEAIRTGVILAGLALGTIAPFLLLDHHKPVV